MVKRNEEKQANYSLFEPMATAKPEPQETSEPLSSSPPKNVEVTCPQCGGRALGTVHPEWHGGETHYCAAKCNDYYFTPEAAQVEVVPPSIEVAASKGDAATVDLFGHPVEKPKGAALAERFLVPPFTVLDARQGYWKERKAEWLALGIAGEEGRIATNTWRIGCDGETATKNFGSASPGRCFGQDLLKGENPNFGKHRGVLHRGNGGMDWGEEYDGGCAWAGAGSSVFDPVLCELAYKWFAPEGGHILDPFAGESTKGIVAAHLGYRYTGIELRPEQIEANRRQAEKIGVQPNWVQGDSAQLGALLPEGQEYDLIFTSPPYYDLEIYSEGEKDGSAFATYEKFLSWYCSIFKQAVARLKWNRFLVVKVGEIRDENGWYRNFVGDTVRCFLDLKLRYYNEAILLTSIGSLPLRIGRQFAGYRKLGKTHQNLLCFYKGCDPSQIQEKFGKVFDESTDVPS